MGDMADWQIEQMTTPCEWCGELYCDCYEQQQQQQDEEVSDE